MSIVDEAVQDGVGVGGSPVTSCQADRGSWEVTSPRPTAVSLLENFEQVMTGAGVEGLEAEIVENERVGSAEGLDEARMAPVTPSKRQLLAELRPAMIEDKPTVAAAFLADGASQPALADAGRPDQSEIAVGVDPFALRELLEQGAVETPCSAIVDIFDACLLTQFGGAGPATRTIFVAALARVQQRRPTSTASSAAGDDGPPSISQTQAASDGERYARLL